MPFGSHLGFWQSAHQPSLPTEASGETNLAASLGQDGLETTGKGWKQSATCSRECIEMSWCNIWSQASLLGRLCAKFQRLMLSSLQEDLGPGTAQQKKLQLQETRMHTHTLISANRNTNRPERWGMKVTAIMQAKLPCGRCALVSAPNSALPDVASRLPDFSGRPSLVAVHYSICNILVQAPSLASMLSFTPLTGSGNLRPLLLRSHCAAKISRGISRARLCACVSCVRDCRACCACSTSSQVVLTAAQCIMSVLKCSKPPGYNGAL